MRHEGVRQGMIHRFNALALITASALMIGGSASAQSLMSKTPVAQNAGAVAQGGAASRLPAPPGAQSGSAPRTAVSLARPPANASAHSGRPLPLRGEALRGSAS